MSTVQIVLMFMIIQIGVLAFNHKAEKYSTGSNLFGAMVIVSFWIWALWMAGFWA